MSQTGPTAWVAPLYPLLLAGVFRIFGVFTSASAVVILSLNSVFSALTTLAVFEIGRRCYNLRVAVASAWVWALYPPSFQFASRWVWETPLSTLLLSCAFVLALRIRHTGEPADDRGDVVPKLSRQDSMRWLGFGAVWGLLSLSNPSLLVFLPFCGIWALAGAGWRRWSQAAGAALVCACIMAPWITRNWIVFHHFVPMRGNGGVELYLGNGPMAMGFVVDVDHPYLYARERDRYRAMGEVEYSRQLGREAVRLIRADPMHFIRLTCLRIYYFWFGTTHEQMYHWDRAASDWLRRFLYSFTSLAGLFGLALSVKRKTPGYLLFVGAFLCLPAVYYVVAVHARFRNPLEPLIAVLGVWLFQCAEKPYARTAGASAKIKAVGA